ncbi:MAG: LacI family DNA-binding transcriptional regulator [Ilumatobacter sp.]
MKRVSTTSHGAAVTLDDVARVSGVSAASVSRALNGNKGVSDDVRQRIIHVAESLGYRANRAARNLAGGRASAIGLVMPSDELSRDPYGASLVQAVANATARHHEALMLLLARDEPGWSVIDAIRTGLIDGVIVSAIAIGTHWVDEILDAGVPTVLFGDHPERSRVHTVAVENREPIATIVERLAAVGATRIAYVSGRPDRQDSSERLEGFRLGHERLGRAVAEDLIVDGEFTRVAGHRAAAMLLERRPDAIVAANDESALGVLDALAEAGLSSPGDVIVTGFDGTANLRPEDPPITTVMQPFEEMSELAVGSLRSILAGEEVPIRQVVRPVVRFADMSPQPGSAR